MLGCLTLHTPEFILLTEESDSLHWDSFLEGRLSTRWLDIMKPVFLASTTRLTPTKWGAQFINFLLQITHKQWLFHNSDVYFRREDGMTQVEVDEIFDEMEDLMYTKPDELLPKYWHLLQDDFEALTEGLAQDRQYWIVSMESAIKAYEAVQEGRADPRGVNRLLFERSHSRGVKST